MTRKRAYSLIITLCNKDEKYFSKTLEILFEFYGKIDSSWKVIDRSELDETDIMIKQSGYVGLKNFGCTCYMNSLL